MTGHALRPAVAAAVLFTGVLAVRAAFIPRDFGIGASGYMYGWHRAGNEAEWKALTPKYKGKDYCAGCHSDKTQSINKSPHLKIACENCHGPAGNHPEDPPKLTINRDRSLCIRCHSSLTAYPGTARARMKTINPNFHNPGLECANCHNPHHPNLGGGK
jgi:predicted CXXCH cytochrome family protein